MRSPTHRLRAAAFGLSLAVATLTSIHAQTAAPPTNPPPVADNRPDSLFSADYLRSLWHDTGAVLTDPLHWNAANWTAAGIWAGATLTGAAFDQGIRREVQSDFRTHAENQFFKQWQLLGAQYSFVEIGAFEAWGLAEDDRNARDTAMDAVTSTVIASGIIAPAIKYAVGRYRPSQTTSTFKARLFSAHQSFPSGHTTQAFAVASVVASHYTAWWQQTLSYGAAALVGVGRIQQNAHFVSDVVAGAGIGWAVGRAVVHRHGVFGKYAVAPWFDGNAAGLVFSRDF